MGSSSTPSRTTTVNEPPAFIQPYMQYGAEQSRALYGTGGPQYYGGNTVVPFSEQTENALGRTEQRALEGSPVNQAAQGYATRTLTDSPSSQFGSAGNPYASGANPYGGASNPYLDATFNKAADSVQQRLGTQFAGAGRNTEASRAVNADELNNLATGLYGGAYENERNRQLAYGQQQLGIGASGYESERERMAQDLSQQRAHQFGVAGLAPNLANQDYVDLQALGGVGGQVEDLTGRLMEDQAARWDFDQNAPQTNLDNYIARITGGYPGGTSTQTTPTYRNRTAGAAGGAMAGAQMGSMFGPWGTAIGAIGGGLLGGWG
jgi:hypothetical protein